MNTVRKIRVGSADFSMRICPSPNRGVMVDGLSGEIRVTPDATATDLYAALRSYEDRELAGAWPPPVSVGDVS